MRPGLRISPRVIVSLTSGTAIAGVLVRRRPVLVLERASLASGKRIDGQVLIEHPQVAFVEAQP